MNDFGSNNLVPHVHVLYLNVGTKWMKNQAWGPNLIGLPTSQVWPMDKPTPSSCWAMLLEATYRRWTYGPTIWRSPDLPMDPPYGGRPTSLWTHQSLLRWQDPREVSQSHSPPLDHTYVFSQGWKMKSHGFMGPQGTNSM
jgi:hypothetical protein